MTRIILEKYFEAIVQSGGAQKLLKQTNKGVGGLAKYSSYLISPIK